MVPIMTSGGHLAGTEELLLSGGDARISLDPLTGRNKYACTPRPEPAVVALGSSTASSISTTGFQAADLLRRRLGEELQVSSAPALYTRELQRIRRELMKLSGVADLAGLETVFSSSGTDAHLITTQLVAQEGSSPLLVIMMEGDETGKGVPAALNGRHFSSRSALGATFVEGAPILGAREIRVAPVTIRSADGAPRPQDEIHREVEALATAGAAQGERVLLILLDQSKSGLMAPTPAFAMALRQLLPGKVDTLVDACQFRLAPSKLRGYLEQGFMVAVTGSKFITGPAFSGALFIPGELTPRLSCCRLPATLAAYSARAEWPSGWRGADTLDDVANFGLLLRWEAALAEYRAFRSIPQGEIARFLGEFAATIRERLADDPSFEPLPAPEMERTPLGDPATWDRIPTIFPFLLRRPGGGLFSGDETQEIYRQLQQELSGGAESFLLHEGEAVRGLLCQLGQPVSCGVRDGVPLSALRICTSSRLVVEAAEAGSSGGIRRRIIAALDKTAWLVKSIAWGKPL